MKHRLTVNLLMILALYGTTRVYAATFAQEVLVFDYQSLAAAVAGGLCGGLVRTVFTLASDNRAVFQILAEARKDLVKSALAGGAAYLLMLLVESVKPGTVNADMRFVGVMAAGWTRDALFNVLTRLVRAKVDGKAAELRAGAPSTDLPSSASVPLDK